MRDDYRKQHYIEQCARCGTTPNESFLRFLERDAEIRERGATVARVLYDQGVRGTDFVTAYMDAVQSMRNEN